MKRMLEIGSAKTDDVEEYIANAYAPVGVRALEKHTSYGVKGAYTLFDGLLIEWSKSIGTYEITPQKEFESVIFNLMTNKSMEYRIRKRDIELRQDHAIAYRHPDKVNVLDQSGHVTVAISNEILQRRLLVLLDGTHQRSLEFFHDPVPLAQIQKFSDFVCDLETSPIMSLARIMCERTASVSDVIVDAFLLSFPNNCSDVLSRPVPSVAPRHVKRAIDYIHANPRSHHSPDVLAALSNVSVRSLQYSFKSVTGHTISEYQYLLRLEQARKEILAHPEVAITKVAEDWGFGSVGTFGQSFKKIYGVTPSSLQRKK